MSSWWAPRRRWKPLIAAAFVAGLLPLVLAVTLHDRGSNADPACLRHCYTLAQRAGALVLLYVGAPAILVVGLAGALAIKTGRRSAAADRAAWCLVAAMCLICLVGLLTIGVAMLPVALLSVAATATAPPPPTPRFADTGETRRTRAVDDRNDRR